MALQGLSATSKAAYLLIAAVTMAAPPPARIGALVPDFTVEDVDSRPFRLSQYRGRVVVVVCEDRGSSRDNLEFKRRLGRLGEPAERVMVWMAVADVRAYDFWPARPAVKRKLREAGTASGTALLADWHGAVRRALGISHGSAIAIIAPDGQLRYLHGGPLSSADLGDAFAVLRALGVPGA
jgi:hypothetical protein